MDKYLYDFTGHPELYSAAEAFVGELSKESETLATPLLKFFHHETVDSKIV
jgi:hypothetical protein